MAIRICEPVIHYSRVQGKAALLWAIRGKELQTAAGVRMPCEGHLIKDIGVQGKVNGD